MDLAGPGSFAIVLDPTSMDQRLGEQVLRFSLRLKFPGCKIDVFLIGVSVELDWTRFNRVFRLCAGVDGVKNPLDLRGAAAVWEHEFPTRKMCDLLTIFNAPMDQANLWLQHGLNSLDPEQFQLLCEDQFGDKPDEKVLKDVILAGRVINNHTLKLDATIAKRTFRDCRWHGLNIAAINHPTATLRSFQRVTMQKHDALLAWSWSGDGALCQMWHAPNKGGLNLKAVLEAAGVRIGNNNRFQCDFDTIKSILSEQ